MMTYATTIGEIYTHVHEVIASQVCRKMIKQLGLTDVFKNHLYFNSDMSGPSRSYSEKRLPILHENAFRCNIKFSVNPLGLKWDSTTPGQHMDPAEFRRSALRTPPIFEDKLHHIELLERYQPCNIEMECSMIFADRVVAHDVMSRIYNTYVRGELLTLNDLSYDYRLPPEIINRLYTLGSMLKLKRGTYMDWINDCSHGVIRRVVSQRQNQRCAEIVVKKEQFGSLMAVDYAPDQPDITTQGTSLDTVNLNFTVTVQFGRVNMLYLIYPIVVNNQLVPENLVTADPQDAFGSLYKLMHYPYVGLDPGFQMTKILFEHPARNPWYDDWNIPDNNAIVCYEHRPFFIGVFTLDNERCQCHTCKCAGNCEYKYTSINIIDDLDQYKLAPKVAEWFKTHPKDVFNPLAKYNISVFKDNMQIGPSQLEFDGTTLKFPNCKGPGHIYRMVLSASTRDYPDGSPWTMKLLIVDIKPTKEK